MESKSQGPPKFGNREWEIDSPEGGENQSLIPTIDHFAPTWNKKYSFCPWLKNIINNNYYY